MDRLVPLIAQLSARSVEFIVIGVAGANYYALGGSTIFNTQDHDLFLRPDPDNVLRAWQACEAAGLSLWAGSEPLDSPRDRFLAERVVERRSAVRATDESGLQVDLTLVMAAFDFDVVWRDRRTFRVQDVAVPVARLMHIIASKHAAGRDKDRLFLATHRQALEELLRRDPS